MANEASITINLDINKGSLIYRKSINNRVDVTGTKGPVPGALLISTSGVSVNFGELTVPAICMLTNLDSTNYVEWGIWDGLEFIPVGELQAGESAILRLSRNLGKSFGVGTGTTDSGNSLRLKANTAACNVQVEAFEA